VKRPPDTHRPPPAPGIVEDKVSVTPSKASSDLLAVFLEAAGIEDAAEHIMKDDATLMRVIGLVLHELVSGLMTVLRGRSELKSQLRVSMTTLKPTENNPFKFSPTVEEALKTCLMNNHPGFTDAVEAVREGYDDIKNHQLAVTAGIQASLAGILKQFDPQRFTDKFKEGLVLQKKAKCWDAFKQAYPQIVERAIEDIFGVDFIRAYEAQIEKLRAHRKKDHLRHER
jgi:type VI secretion system FHA domain protein